VGNGADLRRLSLEQLVRNFGKSGKYYFNVCRGLDDRVVSPSRVRKSISVERTFEENIHDQTEAKEILNKLCHSLVTALHKTQLKGRTLQLKWRYPDFTTLTRNKSFEQFTDNFDLISFTIHQLFHENVELAQGIRLLGVGVSNLDNNEEISQLSLDL
jgi:DNA polymerase-4